MDEEEDTIDRDENVVIDDSLEHHGEEEKEPDEDEIEDKCRGDDKFRCGSTSVYICEIEHCDGTANCPNGEDEENCPSNKDQTIDENEGSGEEPEKETERVRLDVENEVEWIDGDFFIFYYFFFKLISL